jgi:glycerophosphoryl diester phosphodiesterase
MQARKTRHIIKRILLIIAAVIFAYFAFMMIGGGFGKKPPDVKAMINDDSPFLFAHRGVTLNYPENTIGSIGEAKLKGFKGLEIDIRKSSDNEFIIFHDEDGKRLLGLDSKINKLTTAQIKSHPLLFNNAQSGSSVITLKEMLDKYKDDFVFYFDMKLKGLDDVNDLAGIIQSYGIERSSIIASTSGFIVFYLENKYPGINTSLEGFNSGKEWIYYFFPKKFKPDFLSSFAGKVDEKHMSWIKKKDLLPCRIVYDVDSTNYRKMAHWGLKNLIIDYSSELKVP